MKVFVSYGDAADQVTALRLQALGAANGLSVYVPPAYTRQDPSVPLGPEAAQKLQETDVILGVVSSGLADSCWQELQTGLTLRKNMIIMSDPAFASRLRPHFLSKLVLIDPAKPDEAETGIVLYLKTLEAQQSAKAALLALGTLALGLLLLAPADRS